MQILYDIFLKKKSVLFIYFNDKWLLAMLARVVTAGAVGHLEKFPFFETQGVANPSDYFTVLSLKDLPTSGYFLAVLSRQGSSKVPAQDQEPMRCSTNFISSRQTTSQHHSRSLNFSLFRQKSRKEAMTSVERSPLPSGRQRREEESGAVNRRSRAALPSDY